MKLTREGRIFGLLAVVVLLAAFNTGLNLLYLAFGVMAALLLLSIPAARTALSGATVDCRLPETVVAGETFPVRVQAAALSRFRVQGLLIHHGLPDPPPLAVESLPPGGSQSFRLQGRLDRRGVVQLPGLLVETRHPLGLVSVHRRDPSCGQILVVPPSLPLRRIRLPEFLARGGRSRRSSRTPGDGLIFLGVREHRSEDGLRRIHWKSTARMGRLMVRELERESAGPMALVIDPAPVGGDQEYEILVRAAATLVPRLLEAGVPVRLVPTDPEAPLPDVAVGLEEMPDVLRGLARLDRLQASSAGQVLERLAPRLEPGENPSVLLGRMIPETAGGVADRLLGWRRPQAFVLEDRGTASLLEQSGIPTTLLNGTPDGVGDG